jgi:ssDNA-binding Zn-finger/Zn-ribbon topoisomerase 1
VEEQGITVVSGGAALAESSSGAMALAMMSEDEFSSRLAAVQKGVERVRQIQKTLMVGPTKDNPEGEDYGIIPGTKKPTLLKPGAEKLCAFYRLVATFDVRTEYGDGTSRPWITVGAKASMHLGSEDGPVVGEGYGTSNSSEHKHRYRSAKRACPACGSVGAISKSKFPDRVTGLFGWYCRDCKANYGPDDPAIVEQALGQVVNPDPADVENTCLKIAKKRAFVDGTLTTTATSGLFAQDVEDMFVDYHAAPAPQQAPAREPGEDDGPEDDDFVPEEMGGSPAPPPQAPPASAPRVPSARCPKCDNDAGASKYPKKGATHFCRACKLAFEPGGAR